MPANWTKFTRTCGIYRIVGPDGRCYVGQSKDIGSRWKQHLYQLEVGRHHCESLQVAWKEHGYEKFSFELVLKCKKTELTQKEIEVWDLQESCYNGRPTGKTYPVATEETRKKLSKANTGRKVSKETRKKISEAMSGKERSEEHRKNLSKALSGKNNPHYGKKHSEEHKRKLSEAGKLRTHLAETKTKISKAMTGKKQTEEAKKKKSISIIQLDLEGNVIQEWYGINEAAKQLGLHASHITNCCKGKQKTHGGFRWEYKKVSES